VHVVDGTGRPVPGLRPEDFAITVDGRPRPIVAADYVSYATSASATPAGPETARPDFTSNREGALSTEGRTILLVVDEENIRAGAAHAAARAAEQFLDRLQPTDRVGLVVMPRTSVAIDPTTDRAHVKDALTRISGHLVSKNTQLDMIFALGVSEAFAKRHEPRKWAEIKARECSRRGAPKSCPDEMDTYAEAMIADVRQRGQNADADHRQSNGRARSTSRPKTLVYISENCPCRTTWPNRRSSTASSGRWAPAPRARGDVLRAATRPVDGGGGRPAQESVRPGGRRHASARP